MTLEEEIKRLDENYYQEMKSANSIAEDIRLGELSPSWKYTVRVHQEAAEKYNQQRLWLKELKRMKDQQPYNDLISREEALSLAEKAVEGQTRFAEDIKDVITSVIQSCKSQYAIQNKGHWETKKIREKLPSDLLIEYDVVGARPEEEYNPEDGTVATEVIVCSECGYGLMSELHMSPYCPKCGTKME